MQHGVACSWQSAVCTFRLMQMRSCHMIGTPETLSSLVFFSVFWTRSQQVSCQLPVALRVCVSLSFLYLPPERGGGKVPKAAIRLKIYFILFSMISTVGERPRDLFRRNIHFTHILNFILRNKNIKEFLKRSIIFVKNLRTK